MKRKTPDTPKIPSEKAPSKRAETKGILAFAPASAPLTPFEELIEEWIAYCRSSGLAPKTLIDYREFVSKFYWWWTEHARKSGDNGSGSGSGRAPHPADVTTRDVRDFAAYLRTPLAFRRGAPIPPRLQTLSPTNVSTYGCQSLIRRIKQESRVNFHAHQLRHTFATTMIGQGVNLYDLKGLMGHTDIKTTQIYLHDNTDRLSEVYRPHSPLNAIPDLSGEIKKARGRPLQGE